MNKKEKLRMWAKKQWQCETYATLNDTFLKKIRNLDLFKQAKNIMLFYPIKNEINLLKLLETNKNFSFPCIRDNEIVPYLNNNKFKIGAFNIPEPFNSTCFDINELDIVFTPALCADINGNRIGYGKGFYDRFLKRLNRTKTKCIIVLPDNLLVKEIFSDDFDEPVDFILTEKQLIRFHS